MAKTSTGDAVMFRFLLFTFFIAIALPARCLSDETTRPTGAPNGAWTRSDAMNTSTGTVLERGRAVFHNRCSACHGEPGYTRPNGGSDMPGTSAINFKYKNTLPGKLEDRTDLTPALIKYFVRNGSMFMPAFRKTYITDEELNALAIYLSTDK